MCDVRACTVHREADRVQQYAVNACRLREDAAAAPGLRILRIADHTVAVKRRPTPTTAAVPAAQVPPAAYHRGHIDVAGPPLCCCDCSVDGRHRFCPKLRLQCQPDRPPRAARRARALRCSSCWRWRHWSRVLVRRDAAEYLWPGASRRLRMHKLCRHPRCGASSRRLFERPDRHVVRWCDLTRPGTLF